MAGRSFYDILGVPRDADEDQLKKAYKKLALKWHPDRNLENKDRAEKEFKLVSEAYQVLSDKEKKAIYDQYGEEGLKMGEQNFKSQGGFPPGATFSFNTGRGGYAGAGFRDEFDLFRELFGDADPFGGRRTGGFGGVPQGFSHQRASGPPKDKDQEMEYPVSLEDFYTGWSKKIKLTRKVYDESRQPTQTSKIHEITLKAGVKEGTKIRFEGEADERPGYKTGDLVLILKEKPNEKFKRDGNNLILKHKISLSEALTGFEVTVETLDKRKFRVPVREIVTPGYQKVISNEGFPIKGDMSNRGDLIIEFDVAYPTYLNSERKEKIMEALEGI